jgi:hypothetical protein
MLVYADAFRRSGHVVAHSAHRHDFAVVVLLTVVSRVSAVDLQSGHRCSNRRSDVAFAIRNFIGVVGENEASTIPAMPSVRKRFWTFFGAFP